MTTTPLRSRAQSTLRKLAFATEALHRRQSECPFCGSRALKLVARKALVVRVLNCQDCALHFTSPIHAKGKLGRFYDEDYAAEGRTTATPDQDSLQRLIATEFRGSDKDFHERLAILQDLIEGPKLLELGASWGYFLHQAKGYGFQPTGVEIATGRRKFGIRALDVRAVPDLESLPAQSFDGAVSFHVLEHLAAPREVLGALHRVLRPDAQFFFEVPHFDFRERGAEALPTIGAVHPLGLDEQFLNQALPAVGFEVVAHARSWSGLRDGSGPDEGILVYRTRRVGRI